MSASALSDRSMLAPADLLGPEPALRIDRQAARQAVVFAFAAGEGGAAIDRVLAEARTSPSTFDPKRYDAGLFIDDLVHRCFPVEACGESFTPNRAYMASTLAHPPRDPAAVAFRRAVLEELATHVEVRADLERTYVEMRRFRELLTTPVAGSFAEQHQHRVATLRSLRELVVAMASRFEAASSGIRRVRELGAAIAASEAFAKLVSLLDYEDGLATVDLRVRIGVDGGVRGFEITQARESRESVFYRTPLGRFWTRIKLWAKGYHFGELEIMARLLDEVMTPFEPAVVLMIQLLGDMEVYLGALGFRDQATSRGLSVCLPEIVAGGAGACRREIFGLFNPHLFDGRTAPKPCDLVSARADTIVVVTGPNSGGKTRLLQALGIAQLLAQGGFFVPARKARLAWTEGLFVSLYHEVTAHQREGRLGTEMLRIRELFEEVGPRDLALIDELCSGTNPSEAEALIRLVLDLLAELGPQVFVTTHFLSFASELEKRPPSERMEFVQAAIDDRNRPTYAFIPGVAKTSLAAETAARLGVTLEELVAIVARKKAAPQVEVELPEELAEGASFISPSGDAPGPRAPRR